MHFGYLKVIFVFWNGPEHSPHIPQISSRYDHVKSSFHCFDSKPVWECPYEITGSENVSTFSQVTEIPEKIRISPKFSVTKLTLN